MNAVKINHVAIRSVWIHLEALHVDAKRDMSCKEIIAHVKVIVRGKNVNLPSCKRHNELIWRQERKMLIAAIKSNVELIKHAFVTFYCYRSDAFLWWIGLFKNKRLCLVLNRGIRTFQGHGQLLIDCPPPTSLNLFSDAEYYRHFGTSQNNARRIWHFWFS